MKISIIQQDIVWGSPEDNFRRLDALLDSNPGAELYVLPEMFTTGFATQEGAFVEEEPSVGIAWMKKTAARTGAALAGSIALKKDGKCVNRFCFVEPDGKLTTYDKRHLFTYGGEQNRFSAGDKIVDVTYKGVRFRLAVCYDLRFPIWLRNRGDYDALILVANWPTPRRFAWDTLIRARAIENQCYVLAANRVGTDPACEYSGGAAFLGPYGETISAAPDGKEAVIEGEINLEHLADYCRKFPVMDDADAFEMR